MADELARAVSFMSGMQDRMARRKVASRLGTALFDDDLPRVYYLNLLRVERGGPTLNPDELLAEADALQAHLGHRKIEVNDKRGAALEPSFRNLGWKVERDLVMVFRGASRRPVETSAVVEATADDLRETWQHGIRKSPHGKDEDVVRQLVAAQVRREEAVDVRYFTVPGHQLVATECSLFSDGETAQVESVQTLEEYRGRGYASAVVTRAVEEALDAGHELVFLLADDEDRPKALYAKLGFETVGYVWEFLREPISGRPEGTRPAGRAS